RQSDAHIEIGQADELPDDIVLGQRPSPFLEDLRFELHDDSFAVDQHTVAIEDHEIESGHVAMVGGVSSGSVNGCSGPVFVVAHAVSGYLNAWLRPVR